MGGNPKTISEGKARGAKALGKEQLFKISGEILSKMKGKHNKLVERACCKGESATISFIDAGGSGDIYAIVHLRFKNNNDSQFAGREFFYNVKNAEIAGGLYIRKQFADPFSEVEDIPIARVRVKFRESGAEIGGIEIRDAITSKDILDGNGYL